MSGTTLGQYMCWLRDQGGECRTGVGLDPEIGMIPRVRLQAPNGRVAFIAGVDQHDELAPAVIGSLDRRLGILSPFPTSRPQ